MAVRQNTNRLSLDSYLPLSQPSLSQITSRLFIPHTSLATEGKSSYRSKEPLKAETIEDSFPAFRHTVIVMDYLGVIETEMKPQWGPHFTEMIFRELVHLAVLLNEHCVSLDFKRHSNCRTRPISWEAGLVIVFIYKSFFF